MNLRDTFDAIDLETIRRYVADRQEEHLNLEFKTVKNASLNLPEDKQNFARALSGFANSSGGIVVWGVDARKNADGVDCASELIPIVNARQLVGRLNQLTGEAVTPLVDGVVHKAIEAEENKGFAVSLIPESVSGPHMGKLGEHRYYKRSGDSFYKMEHFDIQDMFGKRLRPDLKIILEHVEILTADNFEELKLSFQNTGRAVARHHGFMAEFSDNVSSIRLNSPMRDLASLNSGRPIFSFQNDTNVIHSSKNQTIIGSIFFKRKDASENCTLNISVYCEHMYTKTQSINVTPVKTTPQVTV